MATKRRTSKPVSTKKKVVTPLRVFIYTLGAGVLGGAIYFGREYYLSLKEKKESDGSTASSSSKPGNTYNIFNTSSNGDGFPLKRGSKGARVTQLQKALADIIGQAAMKENGGIDGSFGKGTENALKLAGFGKTVSETLFNQIVKNEPAIVFNPQDISKRLYSNANSQNSSAVLDTLRQIRDTTQYSAVNQSYKQQGFVKKTIVTHLLDQAFSDDPVTKQRIKAEFIRMGLKLDSSSGKWSLSGVGGFRDIITITDTYVIDKNKNRIPVSKNTILGDEQQVANGMTLFKAIDNSMALVPTQHVKYL